MSPSFFIHACLTMECKIEHSEGVKGGNDHTCHNSERGKSRASTIGSLHGFNDHIL